MSGPSLRPTAAEVAGWVARYELGETIRTLANCSGRSFSTIHRHLHRAGIVIRPKTGNTPGGRYQTSAWYPQARQLAAAGQSPEQIAAVVFRAVDTVRDVVSRSGARP